MKRISGIFLSITLLLLVISACASDETVPRKWISHRGVDLNHTIAGENSLEAVAYARMVGFECIETDVRTTSDGILVCMHDETIKGFMNKMLFEEVIPVLPLDKKDCDEFAAAVTDRFNNPFVNHELMSISLNSTSKWKARNMPSFLEYIEKFGKLPAALTMSLAAYIAFYSTDIKKRTADGLVCVRPRGNEYKVQDDAWVLDFYYEHKDADDAALVKDVLSNEKMWDQDLTKIEGLYDTVLADLSLIRKEGAEAAYKSIL